MKDMKDVIERKLVDGNYTYLITFDRCTDRHTIDVKTEDDRMLHYDFDRWGRFKSMYVVEGSIYSYVESILTATLETGQFQHAHFHDGSKSFPIREISSE